jgi:hypothetical protein
VKKILLILVALVFAVSFGYADDNVYPDAACSSASGWIDAEAGTNVIQVITPGMGGTGSCIEIIGDSYANNIISAPAPMTITGSTYAYNVSLYGNDQDVSSCSAYLDYYLDGVFTTRDSATAFGVIDQNGVWEAEAGAGTFPAAGSNQVCFIFRQVGGTVRNVYIDDVFVQDPNTPVLEWEMF